MKQASLDLNLEFEVKIFKADFAHVNVSVEYSN